MTSRYDAVRARMNIGELYVDDGEGLEELEAERTRGKELLYDFNRSRPGEAAERLRLLRELFGAVGERVWIEPPFFASYGSHIHIGDGVLRELQQVIVDDADVHIGDRVMFGPNVTITTAGHPVEPSLRVGGAQFSVPVHVEDDVWVGANVAIMPGVTDRRGIRDRRGQRGRRGHPGQGRGGGRPVPRGAPHRAGGPAVHLPPAGAGAVAPPGSLTPLTFTVSPR